MGLERIIMFYETVSTVSQSEKKTMPHSFTKLWVHCVFSTKDREPLIEESFAEQLFEHIKENLVSDGCIVRCINGVQDHVHILFLQNAKKSISELVKNLKGESSHWVNQNKFLNKKFAWQIGYGAFSISESMIEQVEKYIHKQKEHHRKKTFAEEYEGFLQRYGFEAKNVEQ